MPFSSYNAPRIVAGAAEPRRLILRDPNGQDLVTYQDGRPNPHYQLDLTGYLNANSRYPLLIAIQTMCSVACWHDSGPTVPLPCWSPPCPSTTH